MKRGERGPMPTLPTCPQCGEYIFPRPTPLQLAEHDVAHAEWMIRFAKMRHNPVERGAWAHLAVMYRVLDGERREQISRLKTTICDLEERINDLEFDLDVANRLAVDLKADVVELAEARNRHPANRGGTDV